MQTRWVDVWRYAKEDRKRMIRLWIVLITCALSSGACAGYIVYVAVTS